MNNHDGTRELHDFHCLQYILIFDKKLFQIIVNIYNFSNSFINVEYCSSVIPPRRRSTFNTGNSLFFIISLPFFVNSHHKAPNIVRNPFNDVGIPRPILTPFSTLAMVSISVLSNLLSFSNCSSDINPWRANSSQIFSSLSSASSIRWNSSWTRRRLLFI